MAGLSIRKHNSNLHPQQCSHTVSLILFHTTLKGTIYKDNPPTPKSLKRHLSHNLYSSLSNLLNPNNNRYHSSHLR